MDRTREVRETTTYGTGGVAEARARYGGLDIPATIGGFLAALGALAILAAIAGAILGSIGYQTGLPDLPGTQQEISMGAAIAGFVVLFLGFLIGGWVAGRIARYDGGRNGIMVAIWAIILVGVMTALGAVLGDEFNITQRVNLPNWFTSEAFTTGALISGLIALATMLIASWLGGLWGSSYHRRADAVVAGDGYATTPVHQETTTARDDVVTREQADGVQQPAYADRDRDGRPDVQEQATATQQPVYPDRDRDGRPDTG
ncbi:MAG TPA: YrzE family protein [Actinomycetota bacterium]|nr:YrzE family protein [Actinomycetota bacterium]